jgi:hypothetical protein
MTGTETVQLVVELGYRLISLDFDSKQEQIFFRVKCPDKLWDCLAFCSVSNGEAVMAGVKQLITHLHLVLRLRMSAAVLPRPPYTLMAWNGII